MPAPAAPPPTAPAPAPAPPAPPSPSQVQAGAIPPPVEATPPKPGSAKERLFGDLRKIAKPGEQAATTATVTRQDTPPPDPAKAPAPEPPKPADQPAPVDTPPPAVDPKSKDAKVNPWKLIDEYKAKTATLEKQVLEAKSASLAEQERTQLTEKMTKAEARVKELEDHVRFVDYQSSEEFKTKYQKPYEDAWMRATSEIRELTVTDPVTNEQRPVTVEDLNTIVNMPLGQARTAANQLFGDFADDIMAHRKEIRAMHDAQTAALEDAKKNGAERTKQQQETFNRTKAETQKQVSEAWKLENEAATTDEKYGRYFVPKEGDQEWNQRLAKGYELVDRAFAENPMDPRLKPEERRSIIKRHAAVRNRAAAFGPLRQYSERLEAEVAELKKELSQFKETEPPSGGIRAPETSGQPSGSAMSRVLDDLRRRAK